MNLVAGLFGGFGLVTRCLGALWFGVAVAGLDGYMVTCGRVRCVLIVLV